MRAHHVHVRPGLRRPGQALFPNWLAITLGRHIITWRPLTPDELGHELRHVDQWQRHGLLFPVHYWLASLRAVRARGDWYRDNRFERDARHAALAAVAAADAPAGASAEVALDRVDVLEPLEAGEHPGEL